jgi:hypothetical protein
VHGKRIRRIFAAACGILFDSFAVPYKKNLSYVPDVRTHDYFLPDIQDVFFGSKEKSTSILALKRS